MPIRILVMGLPGSGKTTLSLALKKYMSRVGSVCYYNADEVRQKFNDWDFSIEGRLRQSSRMADLADQCKGDYVICDFVAPLQNTRDIFRADWIIWLDTIANSRYDDTNQMFDPPTAYDFKVTEKNADKWAELIGPKIINEAN